MSCNTDSSLFSAMRRLIRLLATLFSVLVVGVSMCLSRRSLMVLREGECTECSKNAWHCDLVCEKYCSAFTTLLQPFPHTTSWLPTISMVTLLGEWVWFTRELQQQGQFVEVPRHFVQHNKHIRLPHPNSIGRSKTSIQTTHQTFVLVCARGRGVSGEKKGAGAMAVTWAARSLLVLVLGLPKLALLPPDFPPPVWIDLKCLHTCDAFQVDINY